MIYKIRHWAGFGPKHNLPIPEIDQHLNVIALAFRSLILSQNLPSFKLVTDIHALYHALLCLKSI